MTVDETKLQAMLDAQSKSLREGLRRDLRKDLNADFDQKFTGIDKRFNKIDQRFNKIDEKFTSIDSRFNKVDEKFVGLDMKFELKLASFYGQLTRHFDGRLTKFEDKMDVRVNDIYNLVAKFSGRMDNDDSERAAMNNDLDRHKTWIDELAQNSGTTLSSP